VLKSPEYETELDRDQTEKENSFAHMLQNQHRPLSKGEFKEKYLDMLENDPYFPTNQTPRKLMGWQLQPE
jgi:hypothetical protein